jgi:hypothetical protein
MKHNSLFAMLTAVNISLSTKRFQDVRMAFSGEDATKITVDSMAYCYMTPHGGSSGIIGCVADDLMFEGKGITRALTSGLPMVGVGMTISGTLAQTTATDVANMVGAISLDQIQVVARRNTITLTPTAGHTLWMNFDTSIKFSPDKSDSGMKFTVTKPGQFVTDLSGVISTSNS